MHHAFTLSQRYQAAYPGIGFGLALITGCRDAENPPGFDAYKRKVLRKMRKRETLAQITDRIETYAAFFQQFGYDCPLTKHLKRTVWQGYMDERVA